MQIQTLVLDCENPSAPLIVINDNEETSYTWVGNNFASTDMSPVISAVGTYTLTATNPNGCEEVYEVVVTEDMTPPEVVIENEDILDCNLIAFSITADSDDEIISYAWTGPNGFVFDEVSPLINMPGTYEVVVTDDKGCTNSTSILIEDNMDLPDAQLTVDDVLSCSINEVTIESQSDQIITSYEWSDNLGEESSITVEEAGTYLVTITGENGCMDVLEIIVTENMICLLYTSPSPRDRG